MKLVVGNIILNLINDRMVSKLNYNQKKKLLEILVNELDRGNDSAQDKIFKILDSLPNNNTRFYLSQSLVSDLHGEAKKTFQTEYLLKYLTKKELIDELVGLNSNVLAPVDIIEKILPVLNQSEILGLFEECKFKNGVSDLILSNYKGHIDIDSFKQIYNSSNPLAFDKLKYEDQIEIASDFYYREDNLYLRIKNLKEEDRLHIELSSGKRNITPVSEETLIKYIDKYNPTEYMVSLALEAIQNVNLEQLLDKIDKSSPTYSKIYSELAIDKLSKLKKSEKKKYLLELPNEIIDMGFRSFEKEFSLLEKEEISHKLEGYKIDKNYFFAKYILDNFTKEELKEHNVKISAAFVVALDAIDLMDTNLTDGEKEMFAHDLSMLLARKEGTSEHREILKSLLISGVRPRFDDYDDIFEFNDILDILKHDRNFVKHINVYSFNEKELLQLKDYAFDDQRYISRVLSFNEYSPSENNEFRDLQLSLLANIKDDNISNARYFVTIDVIKELIATKKKDSLLHVMQCCSVNDIINEGLDTEILSIIDSSGGLLELYNSISLENYNKLMNVDFENSPTYKKHQKEIIEEHQRHCDYLKSEFLESILKMNKNKDLLLGLKDNNPFIMMSMNYKFLDILNGKSLEYFSRYEDMKRMYFMFGNNESVRELTGKVVNRILETRQSPDELIEQCLHATSKLKEKQIKALLNEDIDKIIYLMSKDSIALRGDISKYEFYEKEYSDNIMENSNNIQECLDAFFRSKMKLDLDTAIRLVRVYGNEIDKLKKENYSDDKIVKSLQTLQQIEKILQVKDKGQLLKIYNASGASRNYSFSMVLEENLKRAFNSTIVSELYAIKQEDLKGPNIYEVDGDFKMLISVIGAYVQNKDSLYNPRENWNNNEKLVNHGICSSLIANNNLSTAPYKDHLIYGFNSLEDTSLLAMAPYDLYSSSNTVKVKSIYESKYMTAEGIIDNTRQGHSELVIERRTVDSNQKRQPDYIVAFDVVKDIDLKAAKEFNIPIVLINTEKIAYQESMKLSDLYKDILSKPSADKIEELIKQYHNNYAGLAVNNPKLNDKYFNPEKFEEALNDLADSILSMEDTSEKEKLLDAFEKALDDEESKRLSTSKEYIPFSFEKLHDKLDDSKKDNPIVDFFNKLKGTFTKKISDKSN